MATMAHAVNAIQKNTSEIVASDRQPVSIAIAYVADEYIPSGNTAAHHTPAKVSAPGCPLIRRNPT